MHLLSTLPPSTPRMMLISLRMTIRSRMARHQRWITPAALSLYHACCVLTPLTDQTRGFGAGMWTVAMQMRQTEVCLRLPRCSRWLQALRWHWKRGERGSNSLPLRWYSQDLIRSVAAPALIKFDEFGPDLAQILARFTDYRTEI